MSFDTPIEVIVLGLITGLTYGLLAVGLTIVYRTTRVINFAHGALGALPATILPAIVINLGWSYWIAMPAALVAGIASGCLLEVAVIRRLQHASRLVVMVATIAATQILGVLIVLIPDKDGLLGRPFPTPFTLRWTIGNLRLGAGEVMILVGAPLLALGFSVFLRRSRLGLASVAAADNPQAALMTGIPVAQVSLLVWGIAGFFAAAAALLEAGTRPIATVGASIGPPLLVRGLAAAMAGGFSRLPRVFAAGIAIGVVEALVRWNYPTGGVLNLVLLVIVMGAMVVNRQLGRAVRGDASTGWSLAAEVRPLSDALRRHPRVRALRRTGLAALGVLTVVLATSLRPSQTVLFSSIVVFAIMGLSLVVLAGHAGQVSLGQYAFVMLGAIIGGRSLQLGFPTGSALLYAATGCGVVAAFIGIPAFRARGLFLAIVTLAFALAAEGWLFEQRWLVRSSFQSDSSMVIDRPRWLGVGFENEHHYALLCVAVLALAAVVVHRVRRTGIGRGMIAVRDNEVSAASMSVSPRRAKLRAFTISGVIAGVAGFLYGGLLVNFTAALGGVDRSLTLLVMVVLGGITTVTGAVLGALWVEGIPYAFGTTAGLLSSALGVLVVLLVLPNGLAGLAFGLRDRAVRWLTGESVAQPEIPLVLPEREPLPARAARATSLGEPAALACHDVSVVFGGIVAVDHVSLEVRPGEIVGLLGPNGAGKTTLFDVLSGHQAPSSGVVTLHGDDVTRLAPEQRAQLGLGRTFQQARLFDGLTVLESVQVALERAEPSEVVPSLLWLPPSWRAEREKAARATEIVEMVGLGPYATRQAGELSTGMRRLAELACVVALDADVILLDEPTAGIAQAEVEVFAPILRELRDFLDATIVIIEHDVPMLVSLVDRLYALAAGHVIASGAPEVVRSNPDVIHAYLGTDERSVGRSGAPRRSVASSRRTR